MTMGGDRHSRAAFELDGGPADDLLNVLSVWEVAPRKSSREELAYATTAAAVTEAPVWRAHLSRDVAKAEMQLSSAQEKLNAAIKTVNALPERLGKVIEARETFTIGPGFVEGALDKPEAELLALLREIQSLGPSG